MPSGTQTITSFLLVKIEYYCVTFVFTDLLFIFIFCIRNIFEEK